VVGNALGDGKPKNNSTEEEFESFSQKYRKELKKDLSEFENEEEDEEEEPETNPETEAEGDSNDKDAVDVDIGEGEEFVSAQDMFKDEM